MKKPMLAAKIADTSVLQYPLLCTPKIDGIRCLKVGGRALSRSFKPIQNAYVRSLIEEHLPDGVDGELVCRGGFQSTTSGIMSRGGQPDFLFKVFDWVQSPTDPYFHRADRLVELPTNLSWLDVLLPSKCDNEASLLAYIDMQLDRGNEGIIARDPNGPYKFGRSSLREGWMLKYKPWEDSEAVVFGFEEGHSNQNAPTLSELGYQQRKGGQGGLVPNGTLGTLLCVDIATQQQVRIGSGNGLTQALRAVIWANQQQYIGKVVRYKWLKCGTKDKPRHPKFEGFRDPADIS